MKLKPFFIALLFVAAIVPTSLMAQTPFELPENIVLETDADYAKYEADIIAASKWLEETDLDKEEEKRILVNNFVIKWINGSPLITINITKGITDLYEGNPILSVFLSSYARYVLEHKTEQGAFKPTKTALMSMMAIYKKGIGIKKNKKMEKLIERTNKGKMDEYIETEIGIDRED